MLQEAAGITNRTQHRPHRTRNPGASASSVPPPPPSFHRVPQAQARPPGRLEAELVPSPHNGVNHTIQYLIDSAPRVSCLGVSMSMSRHPMRFSSYISASLRYPRSAPRTVFASPRRHLPFFSTSSAERRLRFPTLSTSRHQQREHLPSSTRSQFSTMASATQFYDFKPQNSESLPLDHQIQAAPTIQPTRILHPITRNALTRPRIRRGGPPRGLQGPRRPRRQHGLQVRLHPAVPGPREALQGHLGQAPRVPDPRLPLQPVRRPGARLR